jgi:hypothetical protein
VEVSETRCQFNSFKDLGFLGVDCAVSLLEYLWDWFLHMHGCDKVSRLYRHCLVIVCSVD